LVLRRFRQLPGQINIFKLNVRCVILLRVARRHSAAGLRYVLLSQARFSSCSNAYSAHAVCGSRGAFVIVVADQLVDVFDQSMADVEKRKSGKNITLGLAPIMAAFIQV
jgi:hypothetical protein